MTALFEAKNLDIAVGSRRCLTGLSFSLQPTTRLALTGASGLGKTTALRVLCGLDAPLRGHLLLRGSTPESLGWPVFRRRVVLLAQQPAMLDLSVEDNLARAFSYASATSPLDAERARTLLTASGLEADVVWSQNARSLSVGEMQRVSLVRALLLDPEVLLLDEPTAALDPASTERIGALVLNYLEEHEAALILVTHDREVRERWCERAIALEDFLEEAR